MAASIFEAAFLPSKPFYFVIPTNDSEGQPLVCLALPKLQIPSFARDDNSSQGVIHPWLSPMTTKPGNSQGTYFRYMLK
jgi:hypothetical protein